MDNLEAIIEGVKELNSPVIIQTSQRAIDYAGCSTEQEDNYILKFR